MSGEAGAPRFRRDAAVVFGVALAARLAIVIWAAPRFPPTADGDFYHRIAQRIAAGLGYTWLWPDGAVTYAAHYPVGYPGALGAVYALAGPSPGGAMALNAVLGALAALAVHRLAARGGTCERGVPTHVAESASRATAALAGGLVALHPGLVAYTPALMTEGVTAALIACAAWAAAWARDRGGALAPFAAVGAVVGAATLVRPQSLVLAPLLAWIAAAGGPAAPGRRTRAVAAAAIATLAALLACAPWAARNCARMGRCALVSYNGGWNLLIGANPASTGSWSPVEVPEACREVFDEAGKDACFAREARRRIAGGPGAWLALAPRKLAATFDYCGAGGAYLSASNAAAFGDARRVALGAAETVYERAALVLALAWAARGPRGAARRAPRVAGGAWRAWAALRAALPRSARGVARAALFAVGLLFAVQVHAWVAYVALIGLGLLQGRALLRAPVLAGAAVAVLAATALTHAVFFGAGRYALVVFPLLTGLAALATAPPGRLAGSPPGRDPSDFDSSPRGAAS